MTKELRDYKDTIHLPQTEFPMKGNLPTKEPEMIAFWEKENIYQKRIEQNSGKKSFTLPDGPPYANGAIHLGHVLNKTLKDFVIKYKNMKGLQARYIPGWDCHGLPIEHKVMKELSEKKIVKTDLEILELCRAEAHKWIEFQRDQFRRLGVLGEWQSPYLTMDPTYEAEEVREFARAYQRGNIYRGVKPVQWNWVLKTALADAEVEYHDKKSPSIYVAFRTQHPATLAKLAAACPDINIAANSLPISFVIWTTTPWTLPANVAIAAHPDLEYGVFSATNPETQQEQILVIAKSLAESLAKETGLSLSQEGTLKGKDLEGMIAQHPFIDRESRLVLGDHVTAESGTGLVHTAPGHGADDFRIGQKYGLEVLCPVDDGGNFTEDVAEFKGMNIFKANPMIVEKLKASGHLLAFKEIEHSYPHCWRSKAPLIFRVTPQWFIGLDLETTKLRKAALAAIDKIEFFPKWGEARFRAMMEGRPDWCLSRQRIWGVPIPVFYCQATGEPLADPEVMMKVADVIEKEGGIQAFYQHPPEHFIGAFVPKGEFGSQGFRHGRDILDVWFDSGIVHSAVQRRYPGLEVPADIYLEGSDQHRGWFNTSLLSCMATSGVAPFKALITHGFVNDMQGRKLSKSLGNFIDPQEVAQKSGSEILRLWAAFEDYGKDISCGPEMFDRLGETYRRFRNTFRFLLGSLHEYDPRANMVPVEKMPEIDRWALHTLAELVQKVEAAYESYEFHKVYHLLNNYFTVTLSATYLDILKDRLYTWKTNGIHRRASQTVIHFMVSHLTKIMFPILSFLAEEVYSYTRTNKKQSIYLEDFPEVPANWLSPKLKEKFDKLLEMRSVVQKELEALRNRKEIGASLEAQVKLSLPPEFYEHANQCEDLRELLIVSKVEVVPGAMAVLASKAPGEKCVRCWTYSEAINHDKFPGICPKCVEALS